MAEWQATNWQEQIVYATDGPQPQVLLDTGNLKIVLVGLEPGQIIPPHPASSSVYLIIDGTGWMTVNNDRVVLKPGVIVTMPAGTVRGIQAETRLAFLGTREQ